MMHGPVSTEPAWTLLCTLDDADEPLRLWEIAGLHPPVGYTQRDWLRHCHAALEWLAERGWVRRKGDGWAIEDAGQGLLRTRVGEVA